MFLSYLYAKVRLFPDMCKHIALICVNISLIYVNTYLWRPSGLTMPLFALFVLHSAARVLRYVKSSFCISPLFIYTFLHLRHFHMLTKT